MSTTTSHSKIELCVNNGKLFATAMAIITTETPRFLLCESNLVRKLLYQEAESLASNEVILKNLITEQSHRCIEGRPGVHAEMHRSLTVDDMKIEIYFFIHPAFIPWRIKCMFLDSAGPSLDELNRQELALHANSLTQKLQDTLGTSTGESVWP